MKASGVWELKNKEMDCLPICWLFVTCILLTSLPQKCMALKIFMSPTGDQYLLVGSTLQLNCTILQTHDVTLSSNESYTAHDLSIRHRSRNISYAVFEYYEPELTLALTIHNVTLSDGGLYTCHHRDNDSIESLSAIYVEEPPSEPTNLTCVSYNLNNMTCSFSPTNIGSNLAVNWTIEYKTTPCCSAKSNCNFTGKCGPNLPAPTSSVTGGSYGCDLIPSNKFCPGRQYTVVVKGENKQYKFTTQNTFLIMADASIVKPDHVEFLRSQLVSDNNTAMLDWDYPAGLLEFDMEQMEFSISVTHPRGWDSRLMIYKPPAPEEDPERLVPEWPTQFQYKVPNLLAYSNYTVSVRTRSIHAIDDIYWSEPATVTFQTPASNPSEAPSLVEGGYWVQDTGPGCDGQLTCVTVYWKIPSEQTWGGLVTDFRVNIDNANSPGVTRSSSGMGVSLRIEGIVDQTEGFTVSVQMANHAGMSPKSMDIILYPWKEARTIRADWVSVQQARDSALLSWSPPHDLCQDITMVTYFSCQIKSGSKGQLLPDCQTLDWMNVTVDRICNDTVYQWLNNTGDPSGMRYAVSLVTSVGTGGMVWDKYRYSNYNTVPLKPLYQVKAVDQSLEVAMNFQDLPALNQGGQPSFLGMIYKEVTSPDVACPEDVVPQRYPVDFTNNTFMINNLQAGSKYVVCVRAENDAGKSPYGEPIYMPLQKADSTNLVVTIAVVVTFVVLLILGSISGLPVCRERIKRFINNKRQISLTFLSHAEGNHGNTLEDVDSGLGTQTKTSMLHLTSEKPEHSIDALAVSTSNGSCLSGYYKINGPRDHLYSGMESGFEMVERRGDQSNEGFATTVDENIHSSGPRVDNKNTSERCQPQEDLHAPVQSGKDTDTRSQGAGEVAVNLGDVGDTEDNGSGRDNQAEEFTARSSESPAQAGAAIDATTADTDLNNDPENTDTTSIADSEIQNSCPYRNPENISLDSSAFSEISESDSFRSEGFTDSPVIDQAEQKALSDDCFVNLDFEENMNHGDVLHIPVVNDADSGAIKGQCELSSVVREPPAVVGSGHSGTKSSGDSVTSYSTACIPEGGGRQCKVSDDSGHYSQQNSPTSDFKIDLDPMMGKNTKNELNSDIENTKF